MLLAIVPLFSTAGIHCTGMFFAMLFGAMMRMIRMFATFFVRAIRMMFTVSTMLGCICTMFGTNSVMTVWMIGTMCLTVVLADRFLLTMANASLTLFALGFLAMLFAIVLYRVYRLLVIRTVFRLNFLCRNCRRNYRRFYDWTGWSNCSRCF
jgi:hypothetical protein